MILERRSTQSSFRFALVFCLRILFRQEFREIETSVNGTFKWYLTFFKISSITALHKIFLCSMAYFKIFSLSLIFTLCYDVPVCMIFSKYHFSWACQDSWIYKLIFLYKLKKLWPYYFYISLYFPTILFPYFCISNYIYISMSHCSVNQ